MKSTLLCETGFSHFSCCAVMTTAFSSLKRIDMKLFEGLIRLICFRE